MRSGTSRRGRDPASDCRFQRELEDWARPSQVDGARDRVGETDATLGPAAIRSFCNQKAKKALASDGQAVPFLIGLYYYHSVTSMLQFCEPYMLRAAS